MSEPNINIGIFLLEDDPNDAELLKRLFDKSGINNYKIFNCSKDFIDSMNENVWIAIIDHYLGYEITGLEVIDKLREVNNYCRVIIISGQTDPEIIRKYRKKRIEDYIDKNSPDFHDELIKCIEECEADLHRLFTKFNKYIEKREGNATDY